MPAANRANIEQSLIADPELSNRAIAAQPRERRKRRSETSGRNLKAPNGFQPSSGFGDGMAASTPGAGSVQRQRKPLALHFKPPTCSLFLPPVYGPKTPKGVVSNGSVLGHIRTAFSGHPLAFIVGLPFGGFVPIAVWTLTHLELMGYAPVGAGRRAEQSSRRSLSFNGGSECLGDTTKAHRVLRRSSKA